ncbi:MAG: hypothetical protein IKD27_03055 [Oscillospiraceae bacterium]|nr:hypothetical protein [Oscillospiraceae bacterium]
MDIPFEKTENMFWQQKLYAPVMQEEAQEFRLPESLPDIGRVIGAWGQAMLRNKEWRDNHVVMNGGVMVWVLYAPEDGSAPRRVESWIPFSARMEHHQDGESIVRAECLLCSVDARNVAGRKLMLRASVGLMVQTMTRKKALLCSPGQLPEDIQLLERAYPMVLTREAGERSFLADEVVSMERRPERILYYRISPRVCEQKVLGSRAVFRGVGELHLLCQDDQEQLFCADVEVPFAQYLDLDGDYDDGAEVSCILCVTSLEAEPEGEGVRVRCGLMSQYIINAPTVIRCVEDAYSPRRELEPVMEEVVLPAWLDEQVRQIELQERLTGEDVPVDAIFFPDVPMVTRQPGSAEIRMGGSFQTLAAAPDGSLHCKTVKSYRSETMPTECDTVPCTWLRGGTELRREGSGWSVGARLETKFSSISTKPITTVTGMKAGERRTPDPERPSVIIRAKKPEESLWDIAKYCGSTVSAIQRLNKLEREPEENRLLLIPVV